MGPDPDPDESETSYVSVEESALLLAGEGFVLDDEGLFEASTT